MIQYNQALKVFLDRFGTEHPHTKTTEHVRKYLITKCEEVGVSIDGEDEIFSKNTEWKQGIDVKEPVKGTSCCEIF